MSTASEPYPPSKDRAWREWAMVAIGLTGLLSVMAIIVATVALSSTATTSTTVITTPAPAARAASATAVAPAPTRISVNIKADDQHGRKGPDGQWHDAFLPADYTVHAGSTVTVTFHNFDGSPHTFTSPALGVNSIISAGTDSAAHTATLTFKAPSKPGKYAWWCSVPCDPWAMTHDGYMRGYVTVVA
jgi:plastocyanin